MRLDLALLRRACAALLLAGAATAGAQVTVSGPPGFNNCIPFSCRGFGTGQTRYQQVYSAAAFSGPINIGAIGFFRGTPGALGTGSFMLYVSTTSAAVDALNTTDFDANLGTSTTLFGTFRLDGGQAPEILTFSGTSYLYDPAAGNLLLDLRFVGSFLVPLNGDQPYPIAYFVARSGPPGGNYSRATTFGGGSAGYGLDTRFDAAATSVPEPATWVLAGTGLLLVGALSGRWHTERDR